MVRTCRRGALTESMGLMVQPALLASAFLATQSDAGGFPIASPRRLLSAVLDLRCGGVTAKLNDIQLEVLRWIAAGNPGAEATNPQRVSARSLGSRRLVKVKGRGPRWSATLTEAGEYYLEHGKYPAGHFGPEPNLEREPAPEVVPERTSAKRGRMPAEPPLPAVDLTVDSPAGKRRQGYPPKGDSLFTDEKPDPYDEKILLTVKEAAWMLSLPEGAIRQAVAEGDLDRVFIGAGTKNYRIVYGSLLAWVNDMPRHSSRHWWLR